MAKNRIWYRLSAVAFGICYGGLMLSFWGIYTASLSAVILGVYISGPSMAVSMFGAGMDLISLGERAEAGCTRGIADVLYALESLDLP